MLVVKLVRLVVKLVCLAFWAKHSSFTTGCETSVLVVKLVCLVVKLVCLVVKVMCFGSETGRFEWQIGNRTPILRGFKCCKE